MTLLADTSAWIVSRRAPVPVRDWYEAAVVSREVATCDTVRLELLRIARNGSDFASLRFDLSKVATCPVGPAEWTRALDVYQLLADQGGAHQRSVGHADLLIAAAAEAAGVTVLHYDSDFDRIAAVTGQPVRWLLPRGSL